MSITINQVASSNPTGQFSATADYEGTIDGIPFEVQIRSADSPHWYESQLDDDQKSDILNLLERFGQVDDKDVEFEFSQPTDTDVTAIGWKLHTTPEELEQRGLDHSDVVAFVSERAKDDLDEDDFAAFQCACDDGRGPDADADVNGVRWVTTEDDHSLIRSIQTLDGFVHPSEVQAAVDLLKKTYHLAE